MRDDKKSIREEKRILKKANNKKRRAHLKNIDADENENINFKRKKKMRQKVILCRGIQASGKSTWAKEFVKQNENFKRINRDSLRLMVNGNAPWSPDREKAILKARDVLLDTFLNMGYDVLIDDMNFGRNEAQIRAIVRCRADIEIKFFDISLEEAIERDRNREGSVGEKVIRMTYAQNISKDEPKEYKKVIPQKEIINYPPHIDGLDNIVICDIDGTLALLMNNRSPYDCSQADELDVVNEPVVLVLDSLIKQGLKVFFVSGREDKYREQTERFIVKAGVDYESLLMRKSGDFRKDSIVKKEIYEEHIKGKYNVKLILEDRDQMVRLWRDENLPTFQVNYGNF